MQDQWITPLPPRAHLGVFAGNKLDYLVSKPLTEAWSLSSRLMLPICSCPATADWPANIQDMAYYLSHKGLCHLCTQTSTGLAQQEQAGLQ